MKENNAIAEFRNLRADEIQIRPTDTKFKGSALLLLYKDARCDMAILDETVGAFNWKKSYYEVKGNLYCSVGIRDNNGDWVEKSDCGAESNTEAEKGEASDAFKRACVNWGIGRELYTTPKINIKCPDSYYFNDKLTMKFTVKEIGYCGKMINKLVIADRFGNVVFEYSNGQVQEKNSQQPAQQQQTNANIDNELIPKVLYAVIKNAKTTEELNNIWNKNSKWHNNTNFKREMTKQKKILNAA